MADGKNQLDDETRAAVLEIIGTAKYATLACLSKEDSELSGFPAASRIALGTAQDGAPITLLSSLSAHRAALEENQRCCILIDGDMRGDPLNCPRVSIFANATCLEHGAAETFAIRERFLKHQPKAQLYVGFGDMAFFRFEPVHISYNGGFAKAYDLMPSDILVT